MGTNNCSDTYNLIQNMRIFQKMNISTCVYKNGHISVCDQYFFHETCTMGFSTHRAMNPCQKLKIFRVVPFLRAGHKWAIRSKIKVSFVLYIGQGAKVKGQGLEQHIATPASPPNLNGWFLVLSDCL